MVLWAEQQEQLPGIQAEPAQGLCPESGTLVGGKLAEGQDVSEACWVELLVWDTLLQCDMSHSTKDQPGDAVLRSSTAALDVRRAAGSAQPAAGAAQA